MCGVTFPPVGLAVRQREACILLDCDNRDRRLRSARVTGNAVTVQTELHVAGNENTALQCQVDGQIVLTGFQLIIVVCRTPCVAALFQCTVTVLRQFCLKISLAGLLRRAGAAAGVIITIRRTAGTAKVVRMLIIAAIVTVVGIGCRSGQQHQAYSQNKNQTCDAFFHCMYSSLYMVVRFCLCPT